MSKSFRPQRHLQFATLEEAKDDLCYHAYDSCVVAHGSTFAITTKRTAVRFGLPVLHEQGPVHGNR